MNGHPDNIERTIGLLLRWGVLLAAVVVLAGGTLYLVRHGGEPAQYAVFHGVPSDLRSISGIFRSAADFSARGIIQLGLLILIATPIARVAFSLAAFAVQRDRAYVAITAVVLAILIYSIGGGQ